MSCEIWRELTAVGDALLLEDSPERAWAERHFAGCASCASRAFLLDPSWAVRGLAGGPFGPDEIEDLKRRMLADGRLRQIEDRVSSRRRRFGPVAAWAATAAAVLLVVAGGFLLRNPVSIGSAGPATAVQAERFDPGRAGGGAAVVNAGIDPSLPTLGALAPAAARVYDFGEPDFTLVMVVHETLDL